MPNYSFPSPFFILIFFPKKVIISYFDFYFFPLLFHVIYFPRSLDIPYPSSQLDILPPLQTWLTPPPPHPGEGRQLYTTLIKPRIMKVFWPSDASFPLGACCPAWRSCTWQTLWPGNNRKKITSQVHCTNKGYIFWQSRIGFFTKINNREGLWGNLDNKSSSPTLL